MYENQAFLFYDKMISTLLFLSRDYTFRHFFVPKLVLNVNRAKKIDRVII